MPGVIQYGALIGFVTVDPVGTQLGFAQRFFDKPQEALSQFVDARFILRVQCGGPCACQRLVEHPGIHTARCGAVVQEHHFGLVHLPPAGHTFIPDLRRFGERIQSGAGVFAALGVVGRGAGNGIRLARQSGFHLVMEAFQREGTLHRLSAHFIKRQPHVLAEEQGVLHRFRHQRAR